jgi:predicted nucleic acid-binding protein
MPEQLVNSAWDTTTFPLFWIAAEAEQQQVAVVTADSKHCHSKATAFALLATTACQDRMMMSQLR